MIMILVKYFHIDSKLRDICNTVIIEEEEKKYVLTIPNFPSKFYLSFFALPSFITFWDLYSFFFSCFLFPPLIHFSNSMKCIHFYHSFCCFLFPIHFLSLLYCIIIIILCFLVPLLHIL